MALDGIVINSLEYELNNKLIDGKIDKVYQPEKDEILLNIRKDKINYKLLLSANSSNPRIYLTNDYDKKNPTSPPMFCMLLRKHIQSGIIKKIEQSNFDRILNIHIESLDELKQRSTKIITIEIMGKHSNIILYHKDNNKIIDSIKRIPFSISGIRQIIPGHVYQNPPNQKLSPLEISDFKDFFNIIKSNNFKLEKALLSFSGISPIIAREICFRSNINPNELVFELKEFEIERVYNSFFRLFSQIKNKIYYPCIVIDKKIDKLIDFSSIKLTLFNDLSYIENQSISFILDEYYYKKDLRQRIEQKSSHLKKLITKKLERAYNKLKKQNEELKRANKADIYKVKGELITANIYLINKGMEFIEVNNYYDDNNLIKINLDVNLTPSSNAQKYFKRYNKLKNAIKELNKQIKLTKTDVNYLENTLYSINNSESLIELEEIFYELQNEKYIKLNENKKKTKVKQEESKPKKFISSDKIEIYVGKNNKQNDYLSLKFADKMDYWLHTKDIPGSHVIIKYDKDDLPEDTLYEASLLAAYYSKARQSSNVPVDYTRVKNLKKPNKSKPGMVVYETNKTIYVTPNEEDIVKIKNNILEIDLDE
ncbi:MAG: NFACT family protein [Peptostreptococcaceae bacterium]|nr:NFACT family protein [Peptostreptococcaceae bacterium]